MTNSDPVAAFIEAACVPLNASHSSGTLERARELLAAQPDLASRNVYTAAILGDDVMVRRFIERDPSSATAKGGPRNWDPLTYLCFSRYLRLDRSRSDGFVRAAAALLDGGADPNTGWFEPNHEPQPEWEPALYGAAGVAHHRELTRLLLDRGADPNPEEVPYHTPESYDNGAMEAIVESGRLNADNLTMMLLRKADWHDYDGIKFLLEHGADPNRQTPWGNSAFHNALRSDNSLKIIELMLDHGADPSLVCVRPDRTGKESASKSGFEMAARGGRSDVLDLFERRGIPIELHGVERLIAACARDDSAQVRGIVEREPQLVQELLSDGARLLCAFALTENPSGVGQLLDLGVPVDERLVDGSGYWGIAPSSTALHVAAWRASHGTVKVLIERGAAVNARDRLGRTPLALAVKACVDSYWTDMRSPESVAALLAAGASVEGVRYPSGYSEVDELLAPHMT